MSQKSIKFFVKGLVQGVGFRYHTAHQGLKLGLAGYAKNLNNGDVEVLASGQMSQINELALWLEKGPRTARVDSVTASEVEFEAHTGFEIL
ncbi:acylphosphatase [Vibrio nigripulchritudo MADA3029]|uniref:Acylphosphatase n=1 Tax=Vibrio nigripulchritudo SOn1 TaxID=1238450 RepID=A0AAV2VNL6_9VIBR|nr:acylphosphatase [Vibrio nigripulchritudo]EGU61047.1 acylphosphatase [Vibrio nigripulchritudo ATCC 27043]KJY71104.1 acylphosphatase [Vibrio nigripulchritudo]CCN34085.1 acylphosphatase [Vibrio nigripulchritudo AM115]CCN40500.1 acylphosphatase [Vibrio nigripulchritudo FTn2]CCN46773.1 acylphosphatase [Vibrio nigripulchritudo MADA3020]